jgi:hypothetical protein
VSEVYRAIRTALDHFDEKMGTWRRRRLQALYDKYEERRQGYIAGDDSLRNQNLHPISDEEWEEQADRWVVDITHIQLGILRSAEVLEIELDSKFHPKA